MTKTNNIDLEKLSDQARKNNLLENLCQSLLKDFGLIPCVGVEIEFYSNKNDTSDAPFLLKKEKGNKQYEIDLPPLQDMLSCVRQIEEAKIKLKSWDPTIDFSSKPLPGDYGSAMHFHVNFLKSREENYFDDQSHLELAARSLCHYMLSCFMIFAPSEEDYKRFDPKFMAPSNVSFGGNNRSVAIRIPSLIPKRLEHRISSPLADAYLAIFAILKAIYLGLKNPSAISFHDKIYGNAFDEQYGLEPFPASLKEAMAMFDKQFFVIKSQ